MIIDFERQQCEIKELQETIVHYETAPGGPENQKALKDFKLAIKSYKSESEMTKYFSENSKLFEVTTL